MATTYVVSSFLLIGATTSSEEWQCARHTNSVQGRDRCSATNSMIDLGFTSREFGVPHTDSVWQTFQAT